MYGKHIKKSYLLMVFDFALMYFVDSTLLQALYNNIEDTEETKNTEETKKKI